MSWAEPWWWTALLGVAILAILLVWTARAHTRKLAAVFSGALFERALPRSVRRRRLARDVLTVFGLVMLVVALVEPRFGKVMREVEAKGIDLVLLVDLSRSMDATDVDPSRLERARREILDLVEQIEGDRVGMVIFAAGAYPRMPLTLDYAALRLLVDELDTRTFQAQGSAFGEAIRAGLDLLGDPTNDAGRALLVLSDGEAHDPEDALVAANEAAQAGVVVYGLVIGNDSAPIPNGDGSFLIDPSTGVQVRTEPSAAVLTDIARITGGAVARSVASTDDILQLYRDEIRTRLTSTVSRRSQRETWNSAFQWPLGLGLFCLLVGAWLGDGRRTALVLVALLAALPARAATLAEGDAAYRAERFDEASQIFTELSLENPDDPALLERLGAARYRAGDFNGAGRAFDRAADLDGDIDARFNAGNAHFLAGRFDRAAQAYSEVLEREPEHPGATQNLQLLMQELQERQQEQQARQQQQAQQPEVDPTEGPQDEQQPPDGGEESEESQPQQGTPQEPSDQASEGQAGESDEEQQAEQQGGNPEEGQGDPAEDPSTDGTRAEPGEPSEEDPSLDEMLPTDAEGDPEGEAGEPTEGGEATDGQPTDGSVTADQADRTLDSVEEGRPRVYIPGERGSKPW